MRNRMVGLVALMVVMACGGRTEGSADSDPADAAGARTARTASVDRGAPGAPRVALMYQSYIDDAWREALGGENPYRSCAALKGRTYGAFKGGDETAKSQAREAVEACSVTVGARYFLTYLDAVARGERTCMDLLGEGATKIGAMMVTVGEEDESVSGARKARLLDAIAPRVREVCPDVADAFL